MKPHDYESLNDFLCWHADYFAKQLDLWRRRGVGDATCFRIACAAAQKRFPLEGEEVARMDSYIESRFGRPRRELRFEGEPTPTLVAG